MINGHFRIFPKFDHTMYENDTSSFKKGGSRGIFQVDSLLNPPWPPFFKGGIPFDFSILYCLMKFKNDTHFLCFYRLYGAFDQGDISSCENQMQPVHEENL
jgi:hypothetical protein